MKAVRADALAGRGLLRLLLGGHCESAAEQAPLYKSTTPLRSNR
jgi:hypothetical protein